MKFLPFAERVLRLRLTAPQRVLALVSLDGVEPADLDGAERDLARQLFGDVDHVPAMARETLVWSLGRGSGKTTLSAAVGLWRLAHGDASACGPGDVPAVVVVAPRRPTARLAVRMARAMVRAVPALDRRVVRGEDTKDGFALRRPDGRVVQFAAHAAARGGVTGRGFSVLACILDEAEFFASGSDFLVTDSDVHAALVPRLLPGGISLFISTPWPTPTLMGELVEKNLGDPHAALVAVGPSALTGVPPRSEGLRCSAPQCLLFRAPPTTARVAGRSTARMRPAAWEVPGGLYGLQEVAPRAVTQSASQ